MRILIKQGHLIDPTNKLDGVFDIFIKDGQISNIAKAIKEKADITIDAKDKIVTPGLIDMHAHLREPGREDEETLYTGSRAAVKGGFTGVCAMPNTEPPCDNKECVGFILEQSRRIGLVNIYPVGTITKMRKGEELSEIGDLKDAGAIAISDDGASVENSELMRRALEYSSMFNMPIISHCEDRHLSAGGVMNEGIVSTILGLRGIPSFSESSVGERDLALAGMTGSRIHIAHVSTKESAELIRRAKAKGLGVTAETCPHYFVLRDECVKSFDTNTKVNPPLRTAADMEAIRAALADGTIDAISTDHAPHTENEKDVEYDYAPFGIIGLETALALTITELVNARVLSWRGLVEKMSLNPSRILGLNRGNLTKGAIVDISVIDPKAEFTYRRDEIESKSKNSPFIGWRLKGRATHVICGGRLTLGDGKIED